MSRNIVFLVLDTVRKDYFDEYASRLSHDADSTFKQFRAASSWSVPCHASLFTGLLPSQHDIHAERFDAGFDFGDALGGTTFLTDLEGYSSLGVSSNIYMNEEFGFDRLFDEFHDHSIGNHWHAVPFPEARTSFDVGRGSKLRKYAAGLSQALADDYPARTVANGLWTKYYDYLENLPLPRFGDNGARANRDGIIDFAGRADEPFFVFANFMDAHNPLQNSRRYDQDLHSVPNSWNSNEFSKWELLIDERATREYTRNYRELYGAAIDYLDRVTSDLIQQIGEVAETETTVIVTADHGHNLGYAHEDGFFHHTTSLSEGILHVPFVVYNPPDAWPDHVEERFSQTRIPELIKAIRDDTWVDPSTDDRPVVAENIGLLGQGDGIDHETADEQDVAFWNRMIRCGYQADEKYEWDSLGQCRRFDIDQAKPCWQSLAESGVEIPEQLLECFDEDITTYKDRWQGRDQQLEFEDSVSENLRDLGYL